MQLSHFLTTIFSAVFVLTAPLPQPFYFNLLVESDDPALEGTVVAPFVMAGVQVQYALVVPQDKQEALFHIRDCGLYYYSEQFGAVIGHDTAPSGLPVLSFDSLVPHQPGFSADEDGTYLTFKNLENWYSCNVPDPAGEPYPTVVFFQNITASSPDCVKVRLRIDRVNVD